MTKSDQTEGRRQNAAQPLGARDGLVSEQDTRRNGRKERLSAGPDGADASQAAKATTGTKGTTRPR